jgi:hypothetical protein
MDFPEHDWKHLRAVHRVALDRYCARVLEESRTIITDGTGSAHDRYLRLYRLLQERDRALAAAFDDMRRSMAVPRLGAMLALGVVTDEELSGFTPQTRESAVFPRELSRPRRRSRRKS